MYVSDLKDVLNRKAVSPNKWPTLDDFEHGTVWVPLNDYDKILAEVRREKPVVIIGAEGRGKSVLAKTVGFHFLLNGEAVYMIDCTLQGTQSDDSITKFIRSVDSSGARPIWIVEDIQNDEERMAWIYAQIEKCKSSRFIYVWRQSLAGESEIEADTEWMNELLRNATIVRLRPDTESIEQIIKSYTLSPGHRGRFAGFAGVHHKECQFLLEISGGNLSSLSAYLDVWNPKTLALSDLRSSMILKSVWRSTLNPLMKRGESLLDTYLKLAAVGQLDVNARSDGLEVAVLQELKQRGLISEYYGFAHATDAKLVIDSFANQTHRRSHDVTNELLYTYLDFFCRAEAVSDTRLGAHVIQLMRGLHSLRMTPSKTLSRRFSELVMKSKGVVAKTEYIKNFCKDRPTLDAFIETLGGIGFANTLIQAKDAKISRFLFAVQRINPSLAAKFETELVKLFVRCEARRLSNSFTFFLTSERSRGLAKAILEELCNGDSSKLIQTASIASCGKLMGAAQQIDKRAAHSLALIVAEHCAICDANNAEKLALLIRNVQFNHVAHRRLLNRVAFECDVPRLFSEGKIDGCSFVLAAVVGSRDSLDEPLRANVFAKAIKAELNPTRLSRISNRALAALLYSFLLVNESAAEWLTEIQSDVINRWEQVNIDDAFLLLWNILQISESSFQRLVLQVKADLKRLVHKEHLGAIELGLLGLLNYAGVERSGQLGVFSSGDVATALLKNESASKMLFALLGSKGISNSRYLDLLAELRSRVQNLDVTVAHLISKNTNFGSRKHLTKIASELGVLANSSRLTQL